MLQDGVNLSFGTDAPVTDVNPLLGIHAAVTRSETLPDGQSRLWYPSHDISVYDAIRAYIYGTVVSNGRGHELGILEVGKLADIVVLDTDITRCAPAKSLDAKLLFTICDGNVVYRR